MLNAAQSEPVDGVVRVRARANPELPFVEVAVVDRGCGFATDALERIFEPFFTTKPKGEGTGLGLWNAHRLAELMGGYLEVSSRPGCTCFRLLLPASDTGSGHVQSPDPDHR